MSSPGAPARPPKRRRLFALASALLLGAAALALALGENAGPRLAVRARALAAVAAAGGGGAPAPDAIAGVYVVFRRPKPFLTAALSFREAYPDTSFYIVCDSGCYDYRAVAAGLRAAFVGPRALTIKNGRMFLGPAEALALFATWAEVLAAAPEPFFMVLEDDVRVIKRVDVSALKADVNGAVAFAELSPPLERWILARNAAPAGRAANGGKMYLGGMGGNIFRSAFWRAALAAPTLAADVTSLIDETDIRAVDHICSALTYAWNGTVGFYDGYGGGWSEGMGRRWWDQRLEVVHDDKSTYELPLTPADLEALGPDYDVPLKLEGTPEEDLSRGGNTHMAKGR